MTLSDEARDRLADVVKLQPTKNAELADRWGMDSGSEVHQYLESELSEYYYRDENSLIRATEDAAALVDVEPGVEAASESGPQVIRISELEGQVLDVLPGPEADSGSVVSVLHRLREVHDVDPSTDAVRSALQSLRRKGVVEVVYRTVPTYRLSKDRDDVEVEIVD